MANGIGTGDPTHVVSIKDVVQFREGSTVRQTPEGQRKYRLKLCGNKDEDNSPKTLNNKKLTQVISLHTIEMSTSSI